MTELEKRLAALETEVFRLTEELVTMRRALALRELLEEPVPSPAAPPPAAAAPPVAPHAPATPPPTPAPPSAAPLSRAPAAAPAPPPPAPSPRPAPTRPPAPPSQPGRTLGELARDWDLVGPRGFAIAGGAVTALGIGLFFVLAANRGWIDPTARVLLGALASAAVLGGGLVMRVRYGQYLAALAAVGAGIAGAYATLAAAAARYDLVPDALALPLAGVIAAIATAIALSWRSQIIAAIGLLGAALAPALQALDTGLEWESVAFAVIVLMAAAAVSVPLGWRRLVLVSALLVGAQVEWLVAEADVEAGVGTVGVVAVFVGVILAIAIGGQVVHGRSSLDEAALAYALATTGLTFLFAIQLFDDRTFRGSALLAAAAILGVAFAGLQVARYGELALVVGTAALAVAAVGTGDLISDAALTLTWAAQALLLTVVALRVRDARLQVMGLAYATLAAVHALSFEARLDLLFDRNADHLAAVLPLAAAALGIAGSALLAPSRYTERTESGLLAFVAEIRRLLVDHRRGIRETSLFTAVLLGTLSGAFGLISISFEWGHVGATALAAAVGAALLGASGVLRSDALAVGTYYWLGVVLAEALAFDADQFEPGGWSAVLAAAGVLAGSYGHRVLLPASRARDIVTGTAVTIAAVAGAFGIAEVADGDTAGGLGLLAATGVYVALAAGVFRRLRDVSTTLWSLGLLFLVGAESLLVSDSVWRAMAIAATALGVGVLGHRLAEYRLWIAGALLSTATSAVVLLVQARPWRDESALDLRLVLATGACALAAFGLATLRFRQTRSRDHVTVLWAQGVLLLLATERVLVGGWQETAFVVALTGAMVAAFARPLGEARFWYAGVAIVTVTTYATIASFTPPEHFFEASPSPAEGLWVLLGCVLGIFVVALTTPAGTHRFAIYAVAGAVALYALSLGIVEFAAWISTASIETDFERGHTAVSALWALVALGLLLAGILRASAAVRYAGLVLFGLTLAKIFLYDLAELSSVARAFSFILVGALLLVSGFFLQRLSDRVAPRQPS
jgi:uncharacterized membrane protein